MGNLGFKWKKGYLWDTTKQWTFVILLKDDGQAKEEMKKHIFPNKQYYLNRIQQIQKHNLQLSASILREELEPGN